MILVVIFFFVLIFYSKSSTDWKTPGNFSDGTFGTWSLKRVPYPPPSNKSLRIEKVQDMNMVFYMLRVTDPLKSGSSRDELSVPSDFYEKPGQLEEVYFYTMLVENGIWFNKTETEIDTAAVIAQFHAVNGMSPPLGVRIMNDGQLAVSLNTIQGRTYLWKGAPPSPNLIFKLRFLINWDCDPSKGYVQVFLDEKQIVDYKGAVGEKGSPYYYFKYGIYDPTNQFYIPKDFVLKLYHGPYYHRYL